MSTDIYFSQNTNNLYGIYLAIPVALIMPELNIEVRKSWNRTFAYNPETRTLNMEYKGQNTVNFICKIGMTYVGLKRHHKTMTNSTLSPIENQWIIVAWWGFDNVSFKSFSKRFSWRPTGLAILEKNIFDHFKVYRFNKGKRGYGNTEIFINNEYKNYREGIGKCINNFINTYEIKFNCSYFLLPRLNNINDLNVAKYLTTFIKNKNVKGMIVLLSQMLYHDKDKLAKSLYHVPLKKDGTPDKRYKRGKGQKYFLPSGPKKSSVESNESSIESNAHTQNQIIDRLEKNMKKLVKEWNITENNGIISLIISAMILRFDNNKITEMPGHSLNGENKIAVEEEVTFSPLQIAVEKEWTPDERETLALDVQRLIKIDDEYEEKIMKLMYKYLKKNADGDMLLDTSRMSKDALNRLEAYLSNAFEENKRTPKRRKVMYKNTPIKLTKALKNDTNSKNIGNKPSSNKSVTTTKTDTIRIKF